MDIEAQTNFIIPAVKAGCRKQYVTWSAVFRVFYFESKVDLINNSTFVNMPSEMYFNLESIPATVDEVVVSGLDRTHDSIVKKQVVNNPRFEL